MSILIRPPGQPLPLLEKRASDERFYAIDCSLLLRQFELLAHVMAVQGDAIDAEKSKVSPNNTIALYLKSQVYDATTAFTDTPISVVCKTSQGTIQASLVLRVHKY
jgi:hypothetical protein